MELGQKLRLARQEAGLSQRQLCGEVITRNMLSQIENCSAKPSMDTLQYLAGRLGKSVSYFLEEDAVLSPNSRVMERAREAFAKQDSAALRAALDDYRLPDGVFEEEWKLLTIHCCILEAEGNIRNGREIYGEELLNRAEEIAKTALYRNEELVRKILQMKAKGKNGKLTEICEKLPSLDEELMLRAKGALAAEKYVRALHLLESVEDKSGAQWSFLRGELFLIEKDYTQAVTCYRKAEKAMPQAVFAKLETCYRELGDYRLAYDYACKQRSLNVQKGKL